MKYTLSIGKSTPKLLPHTNIALCQRLPGAITYQSHETQDTEIFLPYNRFTFFGYNLSQRKSVNIGLSETAVLDIMAANLQQQRAINEQLRRESNIPRMSVSEACSLMIKYVSEHENEDCLLSGFSSQKVNPFREKSSCSVL